MEIICQYALNVDVLAVAVRRYDGWCAYIKAVPGIDHRVEALSVAKDGEKLPERVATAIFPASAAFMQAEGLHYVM